MTSFDCLSIELLFEIFDYLSFSDLIFAFFNLKQRLDDTIRAYPTCIDLSSKNDRHALVHGPFLCRALIVNDDDSRGTVNNYSLIDFQAIRAIYFKPINSNKLQPLLEQLPTEKLESIVIGSLERQIWSIITMAGRNQLRYLHVLDLDIHWNDEQLLEPMPSLECVRFKDTFAGEMLNFLYYTPNLRSLTGRITIRDLGGFKSNYSLVKLTHLTLYINNCDSFKGRSMGTLPLFWKEFFFRFFSLNMSKGSRKHLW